VYVCVCSGTLPISQRSSLSGRGAARRDGRRELEERQREEKRSSLRVTGPRFIRGERSKVIAQARHGEMSPAGSFRAATPCGRPHPHRRLVHAGSTSSRGRTTTTATTKVSNTARRRSEVYDDDRPAESRELIGERESRINLIVDRMQPTRASRSKDAPETRHSRVATLQAEAPRERGCHRGSVQVHFGRVRAAAGHRL